MRRKSIRKRKMGTTGGFNDSLYQTTRAGKKWRPSVKKTKESLFSGQFDVKNSSPMNHVTQIGFMPRNKGTRNGDENWENPDYNTRNDPETQIENGFNMFENRDYAVPNFAFNNGKNGTEDMQDMVSNRFTEIVQNDELEKMLMK
jgi:hypothetical protein